MQSQVGFRKHHYKQSEWRWWNSSWATSNPKRWCCENASLICQQIWKTQQWPQDWKRSVFIPIPKKGNAKECTHSNALISHTSKVMLKILQARLQLTWTMNFQMFKLNLEKPEEAKIKLPASVGSLRKQESSRKTSTYALLTMPKPLTVWITTKWKIL